VVPMSSINPGRPRTEEEKNASRVKQKLHWKRCETWAKILGISKMDVNQHWSKLKVVRGAGGEGLIPSDVIDAVKGAYSELLLKAAKSDREWAKRVKVASAAGRQRTIDPKNGKIPDTAGRVKIMLWAINKCGGVESAHDALERATRSLEG